MKELEQNALGSKYSTKRLKKMQRRPKRKKSVRRSIKKKWKKVI